MGNRWQIKPTEERPGLAKSLTGWTASGSSETERCWGEAVQRTTEPRGLSNTPNLPALPEEISQLASSSVSDQSGEPLDLEEESFRFEVRGMEDYTQPIGLCASCGHSRVIKTPAGATYSLCQLSLLDERYPKYPVLPVLACPGYTDRRIG